MANTYDPILSQEELRWRFLQARPKAEPGIALVLAGDNGSLAILPGQRISAGELRWGSYNLLYKVDIAEHPLSFACDLPCASDAFDFHAETQLVCSVVDPELIVKRKIRDVRQVLEPLIIQVMRDISRNYEAKDSGRAERAISKAVNEEVNEAGFKLHRFTVVLRLEQETRNRIRERQALYDIKDTEAVRQELEMQRARFEIERQKMKMDFYGPIIKDGNWQMLALQLANNPNDVALVAQIANQQRQTDWDNRLRGLKLLLDADALEGVHVSEVGKRLLQDLVGQVDASPASAAKNSNSKGDQNILPPNTQKVDGSVSDLPDFNYDSDG